MCVVPKLIGAFGLDIDKLMRRIPTLDFRQPSHGNSPDAQGVSDRGSWLHHDGQRSENPEVHPWWSEMLQILRSRKEIEHYGQGMRQPQLPMECMRGHRIASARIISN